jgi:hypothetical protein
MPKLELMLWSRPHFEHDQWQKRNPKQDKHPQSASQNVVVPKQLFPWVMYHIVTKAELEGYGKQKPNTANGQSLPGGLKRPNEAEEPCVPEKEQNSRQAG